MAEGKGLAKVFSGFAQNMCRAVTWKSGELHRYTEVAYYLFVLLK
ncbi:hypothetical protein CFSAN001628_016329 [Clostridium botulinum CFSAN001628]|uniref:Uncharacterized protein n=1 Tax=Clostridium botulinum (strain Okra / Type B1) TaxID=498213 RepID=B1IFH5_CLOBK|nr:hypothetical protein CLD_1183 [Clostridium botulinum B1 str. Okra]EKX78891.1 hypothetical protein CFSAN001628_016329 [Clostridium botulinum CFSAN001628]